MPKKEYKIISVGGSIIVPKEGFDIEFLKEFLQMILDRVKLGDKFILVTGGGATCRAYQQAAKEVADLSNEDLDWLGIYTTWYNAEFVRMLFGDLAYKEVIKNPTQKIKTNKPVILAGGWKPGCSTDRDAVLLAKTYGVKEIINASNIDYVYTADPKLDPQARPIEKMSWTELKKLVGDKWQAGANVPFDPMAVKEAEKLKLKLMFVKGTEIKEFKKILEGKEFSGTVIN